jgi:two-component system nitrogen regulation sensor histidine kinase NtrY
LTVRYLTPILFVLVLVACAAVLFQLVQRRLSDAALMFNVNPEVLELLEKSLDDQRRFARLEPEARDAYRARFETLEKMVHRLQILAHSRDRLVRRYDAILLAAFAAIVLGVAGASVARHLRLQPRLARLQAALTALATGRTDLEVGVGGRDVVGRIAAMIEETSRVMARDRQRLATLQNLSAWQEAARRHAHEMRTPLTGARLELERIRDLVRGEQTERCEAVGQAAAGALQEIDRLGVFARSFTSFARLPRPELEIHDLGALIEEFVSTFHGAWPNLDLRAAPVSCAAAVDRDMIRQVLSNLCDNSSHALGDTPGVVTINVTELREGVAIEVADDGPGIDGSVRERLFDPYTTTRIIGEGMGLGLAISKKILLDHGGDLELVETSPKGTTFRLTLLRQTGEVEPR